MNRNKLVGAAIVIVFVLMVMGLAGTCNNRGPDVNQELAEATREAVESAREARQENDSSYMLPGRNRLLAVAIGMTVPTAAAVLVLYLCLRHRPDALEVDVEEYRQRELAGLESRASLDRSADLLPAPTRQLASRVMPTSVLPGPDSDQEPKEANTSPPPSGPAA